MISKKQTDILKGWSVLIICMSHIVKGTVVNGKSLRWILPSNVAIFFLATGYGLCYSYNKRGDKYLSNFAVEKIIKKLIIPYVVIAIGVSGLINILVYGEKLDWQWLFSSHFWYSEFTFIVYLCFYLI